MIHEDEINPDVLNYMTRIGGSFVKAIAEAYRHADYSNKRKLINTFGYFESYLNMWRVNRKRDHKLEVEKKRNICLDL